MLPLLSPSLTPTGRQQHPASMIRSSSIRGAAAFLHTTMGTCTRPSSQSSWMTRQTPPEAELPSQLWGAGRVLFNTAHQEPSKPLWGAGGLR